MKSAMKSTTKLAILDRGAVISDDQQYRYRLTRRWGDGTDYVCWVMLNPSTADAKLDDPTIRRCVSFSQEWGFSGLAVVNLFAWRATDPEELLAVSDPVGPTNDVFITQTAREAALVVAAWGAHKTISSRVAHVRPLLPFPVCLGTTKDGHPKHPLYVKADTPIRLLP